MRFDCTKLNWLKKRFADLLSARKKYDVLLKVICLFKGTKDSRRGRGERSSFGQSESYKESIDWELKVSVLFN